MIYFSCFSASSSPLIDFEKGCLGEICPGDSLAKLKKTYKNVIVLNFPGDAGETYAVYRINWDAQNYILVHPYALELVGQLFKDKQGLGNGSTLKEFLMHYPKLVALPSEGGYLFRYELKNQYRFDLSTGENQIDEYKDLSKLHHRKIFKIRLWKVRVEPINEKISKSIDLFFDYVNTGKSRDQFIALFNSKRPSELKHYVSYKGLKYKIHSIKFI